MSLPCSNDLRARGRSWGYHYLAPLTFEPEKGAESPNTTDAGEECGATGTFLHAGGNAKNIDTLCLILSFFFYLKPN
jgi:hypothetical protein